MTPISKPGNYDVVLKGCHWQETRDGKGLTAVLPGYTNDGQTMTAYQSLTDTYIQNGANKGRKLSEVTLETLEKLGFDKNNPQNLAILDGKPAGFVIDHDGDGEGAPLKVKFVNPPRQVASATTVTTLWNKMFGTNITVAPGSPPVAGAAREALPSESLNMGSAEKDPLDFP